MVKNIRNICSAILFSVLAHEAAARALDLQPLPGPSAVPSGHSSKRSAGQSLTLDPLPNPDFLRLGRSLKREEPGHECFDPSSQTDFYWGAYDGNNLYVANFTLYHPGDDEYILPVEKFAKRLKSINCGSQSDQYMRLEFKDEDSFSYAKSAWDWVNKVDINRFTVVTEPNQCYNGDNRSPYLVKDIKFDASKLTAALHAEEKDWAEVADEFHLKLRHEYVDPNTANVTHPHLHRRADKVMDISHTFNQNLFSYSKDSGETAGLSLSADAEISTGGQIIADFDIEKKLGFIPTDVKINIHPQGVHGDFLLKLKADGHLGKGLDYTLKPEIEIPVSALNIKGILEVGPFVTMGVHLGATGIQGTAEVSTGARATIDDSAEVKVKLRHPDDNNISGWTPRFEPIQPKFSASIGGSVRAWAELGVEIKVEVFGRWGYQAGVDAQLPYFEASFNAQANSEGVCGTKKVLGVELDANVGINVNLNAGEVNKAPSFKKDLFETSWPLFSTCIAIGGDNAAVSTPALEPTPVSSNEVVPTGGNPPVTPPGDTGGLPSVVETGVLSSALETGAASPSMSHNSIISSALSPNPTPGLSTQPLTGVTLESSDLIAPSVVSSAVASPTDMNSAATITPASLPTPIPSLSGMISTGDKLAPSSLANSSMPTPTPSEIRPSSRINSTSPPHRTSVVAVPSQVDKSLSKALTSSAPLLSITSFPQNGVQTPKSGIALSSKPCNTSTPATLAIPSPSHGPSVVVYSQAVKGPSVAIPSSAPTLSFESYRQHGVQTPKTPIALSSTPCSTSTLATSTKRGYVPYPTA